jgi:hypothetical protein
LKIRLSRFPGAVARMLRPISGYAVTWPHWNSYSLGTEGRGVEQGTASASTEKGGWGRVKSLQGYLRLILWMFLALAVLAPLAKAEPVPTIQVRALTGGEVEISWPLAAGDYVAEAAPRLGVGCRGRYWVCRW